MPTGENFAGTAGNIGTGIGAFISGITTPIFGGTTEQTTTTKPSDSKGSNLPLIFGIIGIVILLIIVAYFVFKN